MKASNQPKFDIEIHQQKSVDDMNAEELQAHIVERANIALAISRVPDLEKRKQLFDLFRKGQCAVATIVPFKRRPKTLREILLIDEIKNAVTRMIVRMR